MSKHLTKGQKKAIADRRLAGATYEALAAEFGYSRITITKVCEQAKIDAEVDQQAHELLAYELDQQVPDNIPDQIPYNDLQWELVTKLHKHLKRYGQAMLAAGPMGVDYLTPTEDNDILGTAGHLAQYSIHEYWRRIGLSGPMRERVRRGKSIEERSTPARPTKEQILASIDRQIAELTATREGILGAMAAGTA